MAQCRDIFTVAPSDDAVDVQRSSDYMYFNWLRVTDFVTKEGSKMYLDRIYLPLDGPIMSPSQQKSQLIPFKTIILFFCLQIFY